MRTTPHGVSQSTVEKGRPILLDNVFARRSINVTHVFRPKGDNISFVEAQVFNTRFGIQNPNITLFRVSFDDDPHSMKSAVHSRFNVEEQLNSIPWR